MKSIYRAAAALCITTAVLGLSGCADDANKSASTQGYQQDRAATGSNIVHHYSPGSGPDNSGVTTYGGSALPGGNPSVGR